MGAKVGGSDGGGMDEINVTPLIDIVLVLLIVFMVLTPITVEKMASQLPPTDPPEQDETPPPPDQLMVAVYGDGKISLNLKEGEDATLMEELRLRLRAKSKKTVFVDAAPDANYARVIEVIDLIRAQGDKGEVTIGFAEMKDEGPARLQPGQTLPVPGAPTDPAAVPAPAPG